MFDVWQEELQNLIDRQCEGVLTNEEAARLDERVRGNEDACRFYCDYTSLLGILFLEHAQDEPPGSILAGWVNSELEDKCRQQPGSTVLGFLGDIFRAGGDALGRPLVLSLLFTVGIPGIILTLLLVHLGSQPAPVNLTQTVNELPRQAPRMIAARITRTHRCVWGENQPEASLNSDLATGQLLELREGLAEITFTGGAKVIMEGPATLDVNTGARGFLRGGKLVAHVPKGAEGFAVATPLATFVDLGTEFGLSVNPQGVAEANVFKGKVEVAVESTVEDGFHQHQQLSAGQAVRVSPADDEERLPRIESIATTSKGFVRNLPGTLPEPTIIFAHRGANDPVTEGWRLRRKGSTSLGKNGFEVGPVVEDGMAAWSIRQSGGRSHVNYRIEKSNGLTPELVAEAKEKGWVLRARVWLSDRLASSTKREDQGPCLISYRDDEILGRGFEVSVDQNGNQCRIADVAESDGPGRVSIPGSRNRYVDYELRYNPTTKDADVLVNGRWITTYKPKLLKGPAALRFGMRNSQEECDTRYAYVEWGILRDNPEVKAGSAGTPGNQEGNQGNVGTDSGVGT